MTQRTELQAPKAIESAYIDLLKRQVSCRRQGDFLLLETPLVFQDGHLLEAYIEIDETNSIRVSDGGFAHSQILLLSHSSVSIRERGKDASHLCKEVGLLWEDDEISYRANDLDEALRRLSVLARTIDRTLSTLQAKPPRQRVALRDRLRNELRSVGLSVQSKYRLTSPDQPKVVVDQLVRKNGSQAAVEVLSGKTHGGAVISVDRAIANFHVLTNLRYQGWLFAVYDEDSAASDPALRFRFERARPDKAVLVPGSDAARTIENRLLASA